MYRKNNTLQFWTYLMLWLPEQYSNRRTVDNSSPLSNGLVFAAPMDALLGGGIEDVKRRKIIAHFSTGAAQSFPGIAINNGYFIGSDTGFPTGDKTLSFWFKTSLVLSGASVAYLFTYGSLSASNFVGVYFDQYGMGLTTYAFSLTGIAGYNDGRPHNVVFTNTGATWTVWIDGIYQNSYSVTTATVLSGSFSIGAFLTGAAPYPDNLWDIRAYNRVLSPYEIQTTYREGDSIWHSDDFFLFTSAFKPWFASNANRLIQ